MKTYAVFHVIEPVHEGEHGTGDEDQGEHRHPERLRDGQPSESVVDHRYFGCAHEPRGRSAAFSAPDADTD